MAKTENAIWVVAQLENGETLGVTYDRFVDTAIGKTGIRLAQHVDRRRVRRKAETLDIARGIERRIEHLAYAERSKFNRVLQRDHDFSAFLFVDVHAVQHLEKAVARTDRIVFHEPLRSFALSFCNQGLERIRSRFEPCVFVLQRIDFFLFITSGKRNNDDAQQKENSGHRHPLGKHAKAKIKNTPRGWARGIQILAKC